MMDELDQVFQYLHKRIEAGPFEHILVSQFNLQERFLELIDFEIDQARNGKQSRIILKLNNLEDKVMIDKLYEANNAGVDIDLILRGICCLVPGIQNQSERIKVLRIVDQYLEHGRAFWFYHGGNAKLFLGSADWMKRNLYRRIEVIYPVYNDQLVAEIRQILDFQINDNTKAVWLGSDLKNHTIQPEPSERKVRAQLDTYKWLRKKEEELNANGE